MNVLTRKNNTNNYAEATFRVVKDIILTRLKAFNPLLLLDFIVVDLEKYYSGRLINAAFGRLEKSYNLFEKVIDKAAVIECKDDIIQEVKERIYKVRSSKKTDCYDEVISDIGLCSCFSSQQGGFCKHQAVVDIRYDTVFPNSPLELSTTNTQQLYKITTGNANKLTPSLF